MVNSKLISGCILASSTLLIACGGNDVESAEQAPVARPVKVFEVESQQTVHTRRFPARVEAIRSADLTFVVNGQLQSLAVEESQAVEKDEMLAQLDQQDYINQLSLAQAQYSNASSEYARHKQMAERNLVSQSALEQNLAQFRTARAQLNTAEKALSDTTLRAPFSGVISRVPVKKFDVVQPGALVATLIDISELKATINLPSHKMVTADSAEDYRAHLELSVAPDLTIPATFLAAELEADPGSQTYAITYQFKAPEGLQILPGMNATLVLSGSEPEERINPISIPTTAVMKDGDDLSVWVVDAETMRVTKRPVEINQSIGETVVVSRGLDQGEVIVTAGAHYLAEGMPVRRWQAN